MPQQQDRWFNVPVLGECSPKFILQTLQSLDTQDDPFLREEEELFGDDEWKSAPPLSKGGARRSDESFPFEDQPPARGRRFFPSWKENRLWLHTGHAFGYLPPASHRNPGSSILPIRAIGAIAAEPALKRTRINITLDRLRVKEYPGRGTHRVLVHFYAQNQTPAQSEDLHLNAVYRVRHGEHAAIRGYPVFTGLQVGTTGLRLRCRTINVANDGDEALLRCLESDIFKSGLKLATTVQPIIAPFSELAIGLAKTIANRNNNVSVQDIDLGLDFSRTLTGARLAQGSYIAVQIPEDREASWNWDDWCYHTPSGCIVHREEQSLTLPFNYLIFGVSRYEGDE